MLMSNRSCKRDTQTEWASHEESFSICSPFFYYTAFPFSQMHTLLLLHGVESKSRARRGGHTATFLSMLRWLSWTLPLRGWWGGMALWRNQPSASIAVIIIWIPDCWICSFGPLRGWEMTCLHSPDTLSVCRETAHPAPTTTLPCSTLSARVEECFFNDWRGPSIKPATPFFIHGCACGRAHFLKEGGYEDTKNSQWKNKTKQKHIMSCHADNSRWVLCSVSLSDTPTIPWKVWFALDFLNSKYSN